MRTSVSAEVRGASPVSNWVVIECSQRQAVRTRDGEDRAVREVDDREALLEQPLLAQRVAVVRRDPGVDPVGRDRTGSGQEG